MKIYLFFFTFFFSTLIYCQSEEKSNNSLSSFMSAGAISVTIGGDFIITGTYPAFITERVDQFITRMYNQTRDRLISQLTQQPELLDKIKKEIESYSLRNITLKRTNGEELKLDLMKFRRTGDFKDNPYLKNDDVLIFPPSDLERNFFSISGAINKPGKYHFRDGDKLSDAIELAQGINKAYENVTKAEINRLSYDGETMQTISVDVVSVIPLQRGDRITVIAKETQKKEFSVLVVGEVNFPGLIPTTKNTTTLKEVIEKAGGLTDYAFLKNTKVYSGNAVPIILENIYGIKVTKPEDLINADTTQIVMKLKESLLIRMSNINWEGREYFELENKLRVLLGGSSVDFSKLYEEGSEASKYVVKEGDIVIIPKKPTTIHVFGQVRNEGDVLFEEGKDYTYYINKAGGLGEFSEDEDQIMVIKGITGEWISPIENKVVIDAGDLIYIPRINVYPFSWYVAQVGNYLSIVGSIATVILLLVQFNK